MKSFDTELKKYTEKTRLTAAERRELRERILSYMEYHPLPKKAEPILRGVIPSQRYFMWSPFANLPVRIGALAFALLLIVGVPLVAERSVPGDVLYLVKTHVNESIQSQFADSPYEKVVFETKLMERRIAEARLLAKKGELTKEVEASLAETVKEHADAAQSGLAELRSTSVEEAAIAEIAFGSALEVQSAVLDTNSSDTTGTTTSSVDTILGVVNSARESVEQNKSTTAPSYEGLVARFELETTRAYELFETVKESATQEEIVDITRRLDDINRKMEGTKNLRESDEPAAINDMMDTLGQLQKLIVFMTDIDVRETVELEKLVPIVLTPEERTAVALASLKEIEKISELVSLRLELITDERLLEKVTGGLAQLESLIAAATTSLETKDFANAEARIYEAGALAVDLDALTGAAIIPGGEVIEVSPEVPEETSTTTEATPEAPAELEKPETPEGVIEPVTP